MSRTLPLLLGLCLAGLTLGGARRPAALPDPLTLGRDATGRRKHLVVYLAVHGQLETLADPDAREAVDTEPREGSGDGLPLRVEQLGLGHDVDDDGGHTDILGPAPFSNVVT